MTFVSDWDWGHYFHYGNHIMQPWKAGDTWDLVPGIYHGSANCGVTPKLQCIGAENYMTITNVYTILRLISLDLLDKHGCISLDDHFGTFTFRTST